MRPHPSRAGIQRGPARFSTRWDAGERPRHHCQSLLRLVVADDPHGLSCHRAGRRRHLCGRRRRLGDPDLWKGVRQRRPQPAFHRREPRRLHRPGLHPDGKHRRERRRAVRDHPGAHGRVRQAITGSGGRGTEERFLRPGDHSDRSARRSHHRRRRRAAPEYHHREARRAPTGVQARRHGDRRQLVPAQRRIGRGPGHVRQQGVGVGAAADGPDHRLVCRRPGAGIHGDGPGRCGESRPCTGRHGTRRTSTSSR